MRIFVDTADLFAIEEWAEHPWVSGFTTNPTLMRGTIQDPYAGEGYAMDWAQAAVAAAAGKWISIDGPESVLNLGPNVYRKVVGWTQVSRRYNYTAICHWKQVRALGPSVHPDAIVSVFAGRIMDTGRDPRPVIDAAKATRAQVLWASVREPYNIVQAEEYGCDIVTVPPPILRKYLDWHGKPLEVVAAETIAQFDRDREGLW